MNDAACRVFQDLINLSVRMMPIFLCLEPKHKNRETIAACSVYLWTVMIFTQSLFHIPDHIFWVFQGFFSCLFFLILLIFFCGSAVEKLFFYLSAWMLSDLSSFFNSFAAWYLKELLPLSEEQLCTMISLVSASLCCLYVHLWMKKRAGEIFGSLSPRFSLLIAAYPALFLFLQLTGEHALFPHGTSSGQSQSLLLFFLVLCVSLLLLYMLTLNNTARIIKSKRTEEELTFARQMIHKQREHYNQTLDYIEQVRIIRHDFRHHIHALLYMDKEQQIKYLKTLQKELETSEQKLFCENQAVNGLIQEYAVRAEKAGISFSARLDLSAHIPIDDLTLCIVIGNLLENAMEASKKMTTDPFIRIQARMEGDHLLMLVENAYNGKIQEKNGKILSSKKDGGLGMLSIQRILNRPGDEFDVYFNDDTFTAMVQIGTGCFVATRE